MRLSLSVTLAICALSLGLSGCRSPYHQDQLAMVGAGTGAIAGAAIGNASGGSSLGGAALGGIVGAVAGSAVGQGMDETEARNRALIEDRLGRQVQGQTTYDDVVAMTRAGLGDQVIITHIRYHGMAQSPTAQDLIYLKNGGVSDPVLAVMQNPPPVQQVASAPPRHVIVEEHHYGPGPWGPYYYGPPRRYYRHPRHHHHRSGVSWGVSVRH
ncbi:MAG: glycine zipper domain-containing protein [Pirellulaceae bacterium]